MIDLGDDEFTRGRPHPMFEPGVRDRPLAEALADPAVGVILLDVVLGYGGHPDPAGHLALVAGLAKRDHGPLIVASVTGTDAIRSRATRRWKAGRGRRDRRGLQRGSGKDGDHGDWRIQPMTSNTKARSGRIEAQMVPDRAAPSPRLRGEGWG